MRNKIVVILSVLIFIAGAGFFLYPVFNDVKSTMEANDTIKKFEQNKRARIKSLTKQKDSSFDFKTQDPLYLKMQEYNLNLYKTGQSGLTDQLSYQNPSFNLLDYGYENNVIGFISIPSVDVKLPVLLGASAENLKTGAVHLSQTSMPIGGDNTNSVIAAHRGYQGAKFFRNINEIKIHDKIFIENLWERLTYEVVETKIIMPSDIHEVYIQGGKSILTLSSCHPYTKNYQRYIIYAEQVSD